MAKEKVLNLSGLQYFHTKKIKTPILDQIGQPTRNGFKGIAELGTDGKVPASQLPSYVDDVLEFATQEDFPQTGETGKIYIALDNNKTFRWSGTAYVEISASLALGATSSTAFRGDYGQTAYNHSQVVSGNPHKVKFAELSDKPTKLSQFQNDLPAISAFKQLEVVDDSAGVKTSVELSEKISFVKGIGVEPRWDPATNSVAFDYTGIEYEAITNAEIDAII